MKHSDHLLVFTLDEQKLALPLYSVDRVIRMVEIIPVTDRSPILSGLINIHGQLIPVLDIRKRLFLPPRGTFITDQIVIAKTATQRLAIVTDGIIGVIEWVASEETETEKILPGSRAFIANIAKFENEIIFVYNMAKFLSLKEERSLKIQQKKSPMTEE